MTDTLRPIEPLPDEMEPAGNLGPKPKLVWADPTTLLVDDSYQRDLNRRSMVLIRRMCQHFSWRKLKPIIAVQVEAGLHVIDGQHGATAAATLKIPQVPVWVVSAESLAARADAFVAHNQDRLTMTPLDIYRAQLGGGNAAARTVDKVCRDAGVRLRVVGYNSACKPGDCAAISVIRSLVLRRGSDVAREILTAFVQAGRGPISSAEIAAADAVMCAPNQIKPSIADLTRALRKFGDDGVVLAKATAATERVAVKVVLAREYRRILRQKAA